MQEDKITQDHVSLRAHANPHNISQKKWSSPLSTKLIVVPQSRMTGWLINLPRAANRLGPRLAWGNRNGEARAARWMKTSRKCTWVSKKKGGKEAVEEATTTRELVRSREDIVVNVFILKDTSGAEWAFTSERPRRGHARSAYRSLWYRRGN